MQRRFWDLLAALAFFLVFCSLLLSNLSRPLESATPRDPLAYPCPSCKYPPWFVLFLLQNIPGYANMRAVYKHVFLQISGCIIFRSSLLSSLNKSCSISPDLPQPMDFAIHTGEPLPKVNIQWFPKKYTNVIHNGRQTKIQKLLKTDFHHQDAHLSVTLTPIPCGADTKVVQISTNEEQSIEINI